MNRLSRRRFLGLGLAAGAAAALPAARAVAGILDTPAGASPAEPGMAKSGEAEARLEDDRLAEAATWAPLLGDEFIAADGRGRRATIRLASATPARDDPLLSGAGSLMLFSGALRPALETGTWTLTHPRLGTVRMAMQAVDRPVTRRWYQLVIDRRTPLEHSRRTSHV